jgi:hypothetical protein
VSQESDKEPQVIKGRICTECQAFVTTIGRTSGVLCDSSTCPFERAGRLGLRGKVKETQPEGGGA